MKKVLVLCTGNSCRSQIAEGYSALFCRSFIPSVGTSISISNKTFIELGHSLQAQHLQN